MAKYIFSCPCYLLCTCSLTRPLSIVVQSHVPASRGLTSRLLTAVSPRVAIKPGPRVL
jgi:hypothetical protein